MSKFWEQQMAHPQTRRYYEVLSGILGSYIGKELKRGAKQFNCLEVGLDVGISARAFLEFEYVHLTSVDPGEVDIGQREIGTLNVLGRWRFHHMSSDAYFKQCQVQFSIIYVDGDHGYEQTKRDVDNAWPHVVPGGLLICHDFLHKGNFYSNKDYGVTQALAEFIKEQEVEAVIYPPNPGLLVIRKP